jgi:hypothetical protein
MAAAMQAGRNPSSALNSGRRIEKRQLAQFIESSGKKRKQKDAAGKW